MARYLTGRQVLARMLRGDLPTAGGGYSGKLFFDDGAKASPATALKLRRAGWIDRPAKTSVSSTFTLTADGIAAASRLGGK